MILADIGVETSCKAVEQLRDRREGAEALTRPEEIHDALQGYPCGHAERRRHER